MASIPHVLILPFPAQGHVIPLMELSHSLLDLGFKITFVNTDFNHHRVVAAASSTQSDNKMLHLVSIPDGLADGEDRNDLGRLCDGMLEVMPGCLEELIRKTNNESREGDKITWIIADGNMAWAFEVTNKLGIRAVAFWPAAATVLATMLSIPKLIDDGIITIDGLPKRNETFQLSAGMPPMDTGKFTWNVAGTGSKTQKSVFQFVLNNNQATDLAEFIVCNSFYELESSVLSYMPKLLPIGPLITDRHLEKPNTGYFWQEDADCMIWLDKQPANSVIYVAFGSFTVLDQYQFQELALGLELSTRPFLWVVRPDLTNANNDKYPIGFEHRIAGQGKIVDWSPQQKVLAHPSVACFLSHCGWNSTIEGVRNGVPFLCWPYFCDQFLNESYICDVWGIGLKLIHNEREIISKEYIKEMVDKLLADKELRARSLRLKERASESVKEGGSSYENFHSFVGVMKE